MKENEAEKGEREGKGKEELEKRKEKMLREFIQLFFGSERAMNEETFILKMEKLTNMMINRDPNRENDPTFDLENETWRVIGSGGGILTRFVHEIENPIRLAERDFFRSKPKRSLSLLRSVPRRGVFECVLDVDGMSRLVVISRGYLYIADPLKDEIYEILRLSYCFGWTVPPDLLKNINNPRFLSPLSLSLSLSSSFFLRFVFSSFFPPIGR